MNLSELKAAFASREKLSQDLAAAQGQVAQLTSDLAAARSEATAEKQRADGLQSQIDEAQTQINELTGNVAKLEANAQSVEEKASGKMQEAMSQLGVPAAELPKSAEVAGAKTSDEHIKAMSEESDPVKRTQYYRTHRKAILFTK